MACEVSFPAVSSFPIRYVPYVTSGCRACLTHICLPCQLLLSKNKVLVKQTMVLIEDPLIVYLKTDQQFRQILSRIHGAIP